MKRMYQVNKKKTEAPLIIKQGIPAIGHGGRCEVVIRPKKGAYNRKAEKRVWKKELVY